MGKRGRDRSPTPTPEWLREQAAQRGVPEFVRFKDKEALGHLKHFGTVSNMIQTIYTGLIAIEPFILRGPHCVELCCGLGEINYWVRKCGYQAHELSPQAPFGRYHDATRHLLGWNPGAANRGVWISRP